jgi:hypothetical protein
MFHHQLKTTFNTALEKVSSHILVLVYIDQKKKR